MLWSDQSLPGGGDIRTANSTLYLPTIHVLIQQSIQSGTYIVEPVLSGHTREEEKVTTRAGYLLRNLLLRVAA